MKHKMVHIRSHSVGFMLSAEIRTFWLMQEQDSSKIWYRTGSATVVLVGYPEQNLDEWLILIIE